MLEDAVADRRRPDRKSASSELIPLFRTALEGEEVSQDLHQMREDVEIEADPIASARGIAQAASLAVPIWALPLGGGYTLLK